MLQRERRSITTSGRARGHEANLLLESSVLSAAMGFQICHNSQGRTQANMLEHGEPNQFLVPYGRSLEPKALPRMVIAQSRIYLSNCGMGGRIARPRAAVLPSQLQPDPSSPIQHEAPTGASDTSSRPIHVVTFDHDFDGEGPRTPRIHGRDISHGA
jgi:hypothetical protein